MTDLSNEQIDALLKPVVHLYPTLELPADKAKWDMGHRCLAYMDKVLPLKSLMLHSFYYLLYGQVNVGKRILNAAECAAWKAVWPTAIAAQQRFWDEVHTPNATIDNLKAYRTAGCGELSVVACRWLQEQGVNAHRVSCFFWNGKMPDDIHACVLFTLPGTSRLTLDEIMVDLNNPNVRICDPWFQKCGAAPDLLAHYANTFVAHGDNCYVPIGPGAKLCLESEVVAGKESLYHVGATALDDKNRLTIKLGEMRCLRVGQQNVQPPVEHVKTNGS